MRPQIGLELALAVSHMSKDPKTQVGCALVSPDSRQVAIGYNGFPSGLPEPDEVWHDRTSQDRICKATAVIHAEENALLNARQSVKGWHVYTTHHPCLKCMALLAHAGVSTVTYLYPIKPEYKPELASKLATQLGIPIRWIMNLEAYSCTTPHAPTVEAKTTWEYFPMDIPTALAASSEVRQQMIAEIAQENPLGPQG